MARIEISSVSNPYGTGELQLQGKVAMSGTLTAVTDNLNTASPLKLSTGGVQVASTLQITTNSNPYIDAEDGAGNNRFTVGRDPSSQVVNVDFASNPTGGTNQVGAIRTYTDGVNLSQVMSFRKDGNIGIGTSTPTQPLSVNGQILSINGRVSTGTTWIDYDGTFRSQWGWLKLSSTGDIRLLNNASIGGDFVPTATTHIKGSGSTSATTSLLVQNSGGTELFKVRDDGYVNVSATNGMNIGGLYLSGLSYNGIINFGNNDLSIGCDVNGRRVNLYSGNTNVLTIFKGATNHGVGISDSGSDYPVPSAVLQADSTTRGFLPPRMTDAQVRAIVSPAVGLMAYNTTLDCPVFYSSAGWRKVSHSAM